MWRRGALPSLALVAALLVPSPRPAAGATPAEIAALKAAPCPQYKVVFRRSYSPSEQAAALSGDFDVLHGERAHLVPPVDWSQDPYRSRTWRHWLHTLGWWMDSLFYIYRQGGPDSLKALTQARDLALDWVTHNPPNAPDAGEAAWAEKVTGDRAAYLAYLTRAAACEGLLSDAQAGTLLDSLRQHAAYLTTRHPDGDHALYDDYGLALLGQYLYFLPGSQGWQDLARKHFGPSLRQRFVARDGVWLANSPNYQATVANLVDLWLQNVDDDPGLATIARRMRYGVGWFVLPDHGLVPFGDYHTNVPLPPWVPTEGAGHRGLRTMRRSGYAVVKLPHSYLGVKASFHFTTHKQGDDLNFELYDRGHRIVTDTGLYDYDFDRWEKYSRSSRAHSVLTVDGVDFPYDDQKLAYGSGIRATGRGAGWYAVLGTNPLLRLQGVRHRRLFLYRPGRALLVVDMVRAARRHVYRRYFQLGPDVNKRGRGAGLALSAPGFRGSLREDGEPERRQATRGARHPISGWSFPDYRQRVPRWTVVYRSVAASANYLSTLGLDGRDSPRARLLRASARRVRVVLSARDGRRSVIAVSRRGHNLEVSRRPEPGREG